MTRTVRKDLLLGILALLAALAYAVHQLALLPPYLDDVLVRAAPVCLVIFGLVLLLRGRLPVSELIGLVLGGALVVAIALAAFSIRREQTRNDQLVTLDQPVSESVALLRVQLETLATDVEVVRVSGDARRVGGQFSGSLESDVLQNYVENADGSASFILSEVQLNPFPLLENIGRATLLVEVPAQTPLDLQVITVDGQVRLNLNTLHVERLNIQVDSGDLLLTMPDYDPQFSRPEETLGTWAVSNGTAVIRLPRDVAARFDLSQSVGGDPTYDQSRYNLLFGRDVLEARNLDNASNVIRYELVVTRDRLTIEEQADATP
ncbi:MAG: hypothetical protein ACOYL5_01765 [Phototrophicaceae bacterium]|jgi:hypothetical protein